MLHAMLHKNIFSTKRLYELIYSLLAWARSLTMHANTYLPENVCMLLPINPFLC